MAYNNSNSYQLLAQVSGLSNNAFTQVAFQPGSPSTALFAVNSNNGLIRIYDISTNDLNPVYEYASG
jgi:hypothetical protein